MRKLIVLFIITQATSAQKLQIPQISDELNQNSNSVIIEKKVIVEIENIKKVSTKTESIILVKNKDGLKHVDLQFQNNNSDKLNSIIVKIYNSLGEQIKTFNKKDFKDHSAYDGISVFNDRRILYLEYEPLTYPIVFHINSEEISENSAFINDWIKYSNFSQSILHSEFTISNKSTSKLITYETNLDPSEIISNKSENEKTYVIKNAIALKNEPYAKYDSYIPRVEFSLSKAFLEGVELDFENWQKFGKTYYDHFLKENSVISQDLKNKLDKIILNTDTKEEKVKKIYKFIQENTRYISIQVGIGGWNPMKIQDIEKYGYGDCKGLSNFARSILKAYDIESYYTVIYGGDKKDINPNSISMQGNHAILSIPFENSYKFLECTSQTNPYAFLGDFTSNRKALVIKPEGGEIINTTNYDVDLNTQDTKGVFKINQIGKISGNVEKKSKFIQYDKVSQLQRMKSDEVIKAYKENLGYLMNVKIDNIKFQNNKDQYEFIEQYELNAEDYMSKQDNLIFIQPNILNRFSNIPAKVRIRKIDFEIDYGYIDTDEFILELPIGYKIAVLPQPIKINEEFGSYEVDLQFKENKIYYKRKIKMLDGVFKKEKYENFRKFKEQIAKLDNIKVELIKS